MAKYIKLDTIKAQLEDLVGWCQDLRKPGLEQALAMLNEEPIADVVPVVHCKGCVHYDMGVCLKIYSAGNAHPEAWQPRRPEDFCSYGEGKEGSDNG